jgi:CHAT domain-containing protein
VPPPSGTLLLAGGIDYDRQPGGAPAARRRVWTSLPGTLDEVRTIARIWEPFGTSNLLQGVGADKATLLAALPRSRIAHLATHGFFADEVPADRRPALGSAELVFRGAAGLSGTPPATVTARNPLLLSGLVLAGANRGDPRGLGSGEGLLTAEEVASADLGGLELVVLSACDTALGRVEREGVFGLQTAFQLAGARTVVASLWKVEDHATRALMVEFYRNVYGRKLGKLEALRQAQLKLLRDFDPHTGLLRGVGGKETITKFGPAPAFFWAAFTLSGDWR